ncbi:MAG: 1-acyl-sn-glycerol-3-phosphate acyltransferase [Clostridia bacterium]|nr:1-acyl-sn-glycerol-3-phosphate acyltransferase [Clostridia bacterium]
MYNRFVEKMIHFSPEKAITSYGVFWRKLLSPILRNVAPLTAKRKIIVLHKEELPKQPVIFASTHGFKDDAVTAIGIVDRQVYVLNGSVRQMTYTADGISMWAIGTIMVDRKNKESRALSKDKMVRALQFGTSVLIYPEGTWNKSPNDLMNKLFPGVYDIAKTTGALVVPLASVIVGDTIYAKRGKPFNIAQYDRKEGVNTLRDIMATLRYEIIEEKSTDLRDNLPKNEKTDEYWKNEIDGLMAEVEFYDYEEELNTMFIDKNITEYSVAFAHLQNIPINHNTAFLFNKRLI